MTRRFLHNTPWSSLLDAWSEVHPRLRYTIHVRDDRPPFKQAARSAPLNSAVASAACLEGRPGPVTPSTHVLSGRPRNAYIVAPSTQGANSAPPKSKLSLLVGAPEAVFSISSKMRWPHSCTVSSPSRMVPQLTSMSSSIRLNIGELVASLIDGAGLQPNTLPRPVVKQTRLAPPATCPVAATGS